MKTAELDAFRKRLEDERATLQSDKETLDIAPLDDQDDVGVGNHIADDATDLMLRDQNLALRGNTDDLINQIDAALARMDAGTYGVCERCGKDIAIDRLDVLPYARYCIDCQSEVERERNGT